MCEVPVFSCEMKHARKIGPALHFTAPHRTAHVVEHMQPLGVEDERGGLLYCIICSSGSGG